MAKWAIFINFMVFGETLVTKYLIAGTANFRLNYRVIAHIAGDGKFAFEYIED